MRRAKSRLASLSQQKVKSMPHKLKLQARWRSHLVSVVHASTTTGVAVASNV
eukprot:m.68062 g.68062  ORF g.68062 m.68062 type:complete len:52 (-) comp12186_c1_seq1:433-588(-)